MEQYTNNHNAESIKTHAAAVSEGCKTVAAVAGIISDLAEKWNGKQFTKRFITAVNAEIVAKMGDEVATVYTARNYDNTPYGIEIYIRNRSYQGRNGWIYFDNEIGRTIYFDGFNGSINAEKIKVRAAQIAEAAERRAAYLQDAAKNWNRYQTKIAKVAETLKKAAEDINPLFFGDRCFPGADAYDLYKIACERFGK